MPNQYFVLLISMRCKEALQRYFLRLFNLSELSDREKKASGELYRKQHDSLDETREQLIKAEGYTVEVKPKGR